MTPVREEPICVGQVYLPSPHAWQKANIWRFPELVGKVGVPAFMPCLPEGLPLPDLQPFVVPVHEALPCGFPLWKRLPPTANTFEIFGELHATS